MNSLMPISLAPAEKLSALRRIDQFRQWASLSDKRHCLQCGKPVTGHELEIVGGTRGLGPLRIQCPTPDCPATAIDMALPEGTTGQLFAAGGDPIPHIPRNASPGAIPGANSLQRFHRVLRAFRIRRWSRIG